jgi:hypothetical protein
VEIGTEAAQFPEKEYINGIFLAVYSGIQMLESVKRIYKKPQDVELPDVPKPGRSVPGPRGAVVSAQFYTAHLNSDHALINYRDTKAKCQSLAVLSQDSEAQ